MRQRTVTDDATAADCPICATARPDDLLAELDAIWVTAPPMTPLPGYLCLVSKRHVREPFELPHDDRRAFWDDVDRVAEAVQRGLKPDKLNYEIHGNTVEHLHLHLFPRWHPDRFSGRAIEARETAPRTEDDMRRLRAAMARLGEPT